MILAQSATAASLAAARLESVQHRLCARQKSLGVELVVLPLTEVRAGGASFYEKV
jgi:hypothetical protein